METNQRSRTNEFVRSKYFEQVPGKN
jgi:hypothetical protein